MKKIIKRIFLSLAVLIGLIIIAAIAVPFLFKDKIINYGKEEANKTLNAKINFSNDIGLSIFSSFPDVTLNIKDLSVINNAPFNDTLVFMNEFEIVLDIQSVIKGGIYDVKKIILSNPIIKLTVLKNGTANWIITKPDSNAIAGEPAKASKFNISLQKFEISNARIAYHDSAKNMFSDIKNLNHSLKGNFSQDIFELNTSTSIESLYFAFGGVPYLNKVNTKMDLDMNMDMVRHKYTIIKNNTTLNELIMKMEGFLAMPDTTKMEMDLKFGVEKSEFKNFLSLIPTLYSNSFKDLTASGKFEFNGFAKGVMQGSNLPSFGLKMLIENGKFKYPSLPSSVDDVQVKVEVNNPGGDANNTIVDISKMHLMLANQPVDAKLLIKTPVKDLYVDGNIKGNINFTEIIQIVPLEKGTTLSGLLKSDVSFKGFLSSIEKKQYENFDMQGTADFKDVNYKSPTMVEMVSIKNAGLNFSPKEVTLKNCEMNLGKSDLSLDGSLQNFLGYFMKGGQILVGKLNLNSNYFDTRPYVPIEDPNTKKLEESKKESLPLVDNFQLPENIDFTMNGKMKQLIYQTYNIKDLTGVIHLHDQKIDFNQVDLNLLDGSFLMSGYYDTKEKNNHKADFDMSLKGVSIPAAYKQFVSIQKFAKIANYIIGMMDAKININTNIVKGYTPDYQNLTSVGSLNIPKAAIENLPILKILAEKLKMPSLNNLQLTNLNPSYEVKEGKFRLTKPMNFTVQGIKMNLDGSNGLDKSLNYELLMNIPSKMMDASVSSLSAMASSIPGGGIKLPEVIPVKALISGTFEKPIVKLDFQGMGKSLLNDAKDRLKAEADRKIKELKDKASIEINKARDKAIAEKDKLEAQGRAEAEKQKQKLQEDKQKAEQEIKRQADEQKKKLDEERKKAEQEAKNKLKNMFGK